MGKLPLLQRLVALSILRQRDFQLLRSVTQTQHYTLVSDLAQTDPYRNGLTTFR